jgi:hypothetical protein
VQQVIEVPADAGERLVKRADVDADAERLLAPRGFPPRAAETSEELMA